MLSDTIETECGFSVRLIEELPTCPGGTNGIAGVEVLNPNGLINYEWLDLDWPIDIAPVIEGISSGTYTLEIDHADEDCRDTLVFVLPEIEPVDYSLEVLNSPTCPGDEDASFIVIIETVSLVDSYEFAINEKDFQSDSLFTGLSAGNYTIWVRNSQGCLFPDTLLIEDPETPIIDFEVEDVTCFGDSSGSFIVIIETVSILTQDYDYSADGGESYQADSLFTGLTAGLYEVFVRNPDGCIFTTEVTVDEPVPEEVSLSIVDVSCAGYSDGSVSVFLPVVEIELSLDGINYEMTETIGGLSEGVYTLYIRNNIGCVDTEPFSISGPLPLQVEGAIEYNNSIGVIKLTPTGGTRPYYYLWSNESNDSTLIGWGVGTYSVTITDSNQCSTVETFVLTDVAEPEGLEYSIYPTPFMEELHLDLQLNEAKKVHIELWSVLGELLLKKEGNQQRHQQIMLSLGDLPSAVYYLQIHWGDQVLTRRIVKQ